MDIIFFLLVLLIIGVTLDVLSLKWGVDSRDTLNSSEWSRRKERELSL